MLWAQEHDQPANKLGVGWPGNLTVGFGRKADLPALAIPVGPSGLNDGANIPLHIVAAVLDLQVPSKQGINVSL